MLISAQGKTVEAASSSAGDQRHVTSLVTKRASDTRVLDTEPRSYGRRANSAGRGPAPGCAWPSGAGGTVAGFAPGLDAQGQCG